MTSSSTEKRIPPLPCSQDNGPHDSGEPSTSIDQWDVPNMLNERVTALGCDLSELQIYRRSSIDPCQLIHFFSRCRAVLYNYCRLSSVSNFTSDRVRIVFVGSVEGSVFVPSSSGKFERLTHAEHGERILATPYLAGEVLDVRTENQQCAFKTTRDRCCSRTGKPDRSLRILSSAPRLPKIDGLTLGGTSLHQRACCTMTWSSRPTNGRLELMNCFAGHGNS